MSKDTSVSIEAIRKEVHTRLAALTPDEAKALRARFGIGRVARTAAEEDEAALHEMARELALLKKQRR